MAARFDDLLERSMAELHTVLFDANPIPTFVIDADCGVIDFNASASEFLGTTPSEVFRHAPGDLLQCSNAVETMHACGSGPKCHNCGVRNVTLDALQGRTTSRFLHSMELIRNDEKEEVTFLVTAAPVTNGDERLALLMLEDITELMALRRRAVAAAGAIAGFTRQ